MGQGTLCSPGDQASICLMQGSSLSTVLSLHPSPLSCLSDPHPCSVSPAMGPLLFLSLLPVPARVRPVAETEVYSWGLGGEVWHRGTHNPDPIPVGP